MKKGTVLNIILIVLVLAGLSLILYPTVSDRLNARSQSKVISDYSQTLSAMEQPDFEKLRQQAQAYNEGIKERVNVFRPDEAELEAYQAALNVDGNGVMGYVVIPKIKCSMPIYHGTEDSTLQVAIGHMEWTSLPVGGESSHCVISGHSGLPSARLFTDIEKLTLGDSFYLRVLDEELYYQVDQILVVLPEQTDALRIVEGEDYCTLVTCTPYGVNSHRLLVRGHRVDGPDTEAPVQQSSPASAQSPAEDSAPRLWAIGIITAAAMIETMIMIFSRKTRKKEAGK